jgi:hypothetical protein
MRIVSLKSDELFHKVNLNVLLYMYVKLEYFTRNIDITSQFESIVVYVCETKLENKNTLRNTIHQTRTHRLYLPLNADFHSLANICVFRERHLGPGFPTSYVVVLFKLIELR